MSFEVLSLEKKEPIVTKIEGKLIFNMRQYLNLQGELLMRYDSPFFDNAEPTAKEAFTFLDKYFFQIVEEIGEFAPEPIGSEESKFELLDVLGYCGSTIAALEKIVGDKIFDHMHIELQKVYVPSAKHHTQLVGDLLIAITNVRRMFPERKWHKDAPACSHDELIERCKIATDGIVHLMRLSLDYWNGVFKFGDNPEVNGDMETCTDDGSIFDLAYDAKLKTIRTTFN
jgi:hypothetical protein